jgi:hypothetical protein
MDAHSLHRPPWKKNRLRRDKERDPSPKDRANLRTPQFLPRPEIGQANEGEKSPADLSARVTIAVFEPRAAPVSAAPSSYNKNIARNIDRHTHRGQLHENS